RCDGATANELRVVPEAVSLHVVIGDLDDPLGAKGLPSQVLAAVPAAGRARKALHLLARLLLRDCPVLPGVALERVLAQRCQFGNALPAHGLLERRRDPDVVQSARVVVKAE